MEVPSRETCATGILALYFFDKRLLVVRTIAEVEVGLAL